MSKFVIYFKVIFFSPMGKECYAANAGKPKRENAKQWRQQVPLHKTHTNKQNKQNKAKQSNK